MRNRRKCATLFHGASLRLAQRQRRLFTCSPAKLREGRAMLQAGIVGLPNVGKSTLFNAVTRTPKGAGGKLPFLHDRPEPGVVTVPDERLSVLSEISSIAETHPRRDRVRRYRRPRRRGAPRAGLGNKFLANIREVDAIVQVVRCFEDDDIIHELGSVDPVRDIEIINAELILADMAALENAARSRKKKAKGGDKEAKAEVDSSKSSSPTSTTANPPSPSSSPTTSRSSMQRASSSSLPSAPSSPATSPKTTSPRRETPTNTPSSPRSKPTRRTPRCRGVVI